jgi:putative ABC transport system permease protein
MLGLCAPLKIVGCPAPPVVATADAGTPLGNDLTDLAHGELGTDSAPDSALPRLDLLGATAGGAPNVVSLEVAGIARQGVKELDDNYVAMPLGLAQQLVYGRGEHKVTGIVLQLNRTEDITWIWKCMALPNLIRSMARWWRCSARSLFSSPSSWA